MTVSEQYPFALDDHPAKASHALIDDDVRHFARVATCLGAQIADLEQRLDAHRRAPGGGGQAALDRDLEIHRLTARLALLRRFGLDLCLGRIVTEHEVRYVGRIGLRDERGDTLLVDWRTPAAEPFFGATLAHPMGVTTRRRYRWTDRRVTDYWDEAFTEDALASGGALDDQSAFIASLGASRSPRMRDVLGTIQADQDAIIRAGADGVLVVDGGPGTGKTVVALHRAAYLLYADPRLRSGHGGVLFVGPSRAYTSYVADILPGLGEEGVRTCTLADLVPEGRDAVPETDPRVAGIKADRRMADAVEAAIALRQRPPTRTTSIETAWGELPITAHDWAEAIAAADPGATHNAAREDIWNALLEILLDRVAPRTDDRADDDGPASRLDDQGWGDAGAGWDDDRDWDSDGSQDDRSEDGDWDERPWDDELAATGLRRGFDDEAQFDAYGQGERQDATDVVRRSLNENAQLRALLDASWPLLDPAAVVRELVSSPDLLRRCAPWLTAAELAALHRPAGAPWTVADLPLLDAARLRTGDPEEAARRRREQEEAAADRAFMDDVVADLIATDDSEMQVMSMLRGQDLRGALAAAPVAEERAGGSLAGPFAHVVVDEAQELTDAEWGMLLRRVPSRSLTVVGDRAQARADFVESWQERLTSLGLRDVTVALLTVNYRTPAEIMTEAAPVIRAVRPDANVPTSVRRSGVAVRYGRVAERDDVVRRWLAEHDDGTACVIGDPTFLATPRVRALTPLEAKGLEFDLVVLVEAEPERGSGQADGQEVQQERVRAAVDRYVAMTRSTRELVILR